MISNGFRNILLAALSLATAACSDDSQINTPTFAAATQATQCAHEVIGTSFPASSGNPAVIDEVSGTVISANFFNSGAIDPPYFDGEENVSVCVSGYDQSGNRTATITTDVGLDNDFFIKAYPQFLIGTKFGNIFETSFRYYSTVNLPDEDKWPVVATGLDENGEPFEFANLDYVANKKSIGLPAFTNSLPPTTVTLDLDEVNVIGAERDVMLESWFFDTARNADIIGNNVATNQPLANSLNNIVGVGHRHYTELDNTLLEMMVHIGSLSPHDISNSQNNPGQNQLTEIYSGNDHDGDGIDDHIDVDSHAFLNSNNPLDPSPGIYSSGIDQNADGIDDADLLPVVIGDYAYSIWYGESFLSPIIIFSRETNLSLTNDFDQATPDMDLTSEGEINLPWNEFINYTLNNIEPQLQALNVGWATGAENPFPAMRSTSSAIGGIELGVEPQTNNAQDQPYELLINKFVVDVGGTKSGLIPDNLPPTITIVTPDLLHTSAATVLSGITNDTESGIKDVRIVLRDRSLNKFYNFANSSFAGAIGNGNHPASLTNTGDTSSNWSYTVQLPDGQYTLGVRSIDNAGNFSNWEFRRFTVDSNDNPTASITNPATDDTALPAGPFTVSGNATDPDGTGFKFVRIAIRNRTTGTAYNFNNNTFSGAVGNGATSAILNNTTSTSTNWSYNVTLPPGEYTLAVRTFNNINETSDWVFRRFIIQGPDIQQPSTTISVPAQDSTIVAPGALTFSGSAVDNGGSGFKFVRFSIRNRTLGQAYNFTNNSFTGAIGNGATSAILNNTTNSATAWSYSVNLPAGEYTIAARAIDNANNQSDWVFRRFSVQTPDTQNPSTVITSPSASTLPAGNIAFSGLSTDAGGSGFKFVRIAIRNRTLGKAYNYNNNSFIGAIGNGATTAILGNTSATSTDWSYSASLPTGDYTLSVRTFDNAGNASAWTFQRFSVQ